jgi:hypothetical protein
MATYTSKQYANSPKSMVGAFPGNMIGFYWEVVLTTAAANADIFNFGVVPKGFRVLGATIESTDIDTNGSPTVTINVGDSGSATRYFSGATVGQAGTASVASAVAGLHYLNTDDTLITGVIAAGPATGATGSVYLSIWGRFEGSAS